MKFLLATISAILIPVQAICSVLPLPLEDCGQIWLTPNLQWTLIVRKNGSATLKYSASLSAKEVPAGTLDFEKVYSTLRSAAPGQNDTISVNLIVREAKRAEGAKSAFPLVAEISPEIKDVFAAFLSAKGVYEHPEAKMFSWDKSKPEKE